jgi:flavin reductase (DIM6/NTAB) family NADH-FMN oxidoreductase RutF
MFYEPHKKNHGLTRDPFKALVAPRPVGWIASTSGRGEINLAPYSFFNAVSAEPPILMFASERRKDTLVFAEETKEFVYNLATWDLRSQMNTTSGAYPRGINEMTEAGLEAAPCVLVRPPRVKASPCAMECKWLQTVQLNDLDGNATERYVVFGQVVGIHIDERYIRDGFLDTAAMRPIARAGYHDYFVATPQTRFVLRRPTDAGTGTADQIKAKAS